MQVYSEKRNLGRGSLQGQATRDINGGEKGFQQAGTGSGAARARVDRYEHQTGAAEVADAAPAGKMTAKQAGDFARRYDVNNMTSEDYHSLLRELKDGGLISLKGYGICSGGEVPYKTPEEPIFKAFVKEDDTAIWPSGDEKADFLKLLKQNMDLCSQFLLDGAASDAERQNAQSMQSEYSHVISLFQQISDARGIQNPH